MLERIRLLAIALLLVWLCSSTYSALNVAAWKLASAFEALRPLSVWALTVFLPNTGTGFLLGGAAALLVGSRAILVGTVVALAFSFWLVLRELSANSYSIGLVGPLPELRWNLVASSSQTAMAGLGGALSGWLVSRIVARWDAWWKADGYPRLHPGAYRLFFPYGGWRPATLGLLFLVNAVHNLTGSYDVWTGAYNQGQAGMPIWILGEPQEVILHTAVWGILFAILSVVCFWYAYKRVLSARHDVVTIERTGITFRTGNQPEQTVPWPALQGLVVESPLGWADWRNLTLLTASERITLSSYLERKDEFIEEIQSEKQFVPRIEGHRTYYEPSTS